MESKVLALLQEREKFQKKLKYLLAEFEDADNDNEDTWGGHDGPQALRMENEKYVYDEAIQEINLELLKLGYKDKIG